MVDRASIVGALREIASLLSLRGGSKFKVRAFERGARALEASRAPLDQRVAEGRLRELPGVGAALAAQIEELFRTGRSELLESLREGLPSGVLELSQISGVGLHALRTLHDELGVATVEDLKAAAREGRLRHARGFGTKKEEKLLRAIERYETTAPMITLADGLRRSESLQQELESRFGRGMVHVGGPLRRAAEVFDVLVFVVESAAPAQVLADVATMPRVGSVERPSDDGGRLRLVDGARLEIVVTSREARPTTLAWSIASDRHWRRLGERARERGWKLSRGGLYDGRRRLPLGDEHELYARLGLAWVPPELREDEGEIERAESDEPFVLVEEDDVRGFVHCHTTWSDGKADIEQMARAAEARGADFITITDHSASAHYANGLDRERLARQWDEIAAVQEKVKIRILRGSEVDILADGALDFADDVLEELDVVIASIHQRHRLDEAKMTERVLRAMRHPLFKIWGHPLGRLVTSRPPIPLRVEEVLDALAASRGALEINGDPARLDLEPRWVRAARERGIPFVLSVDAHSVTALGNLTYAVKIARRGGVIAKEVLNARRADDFLEAVRPSAT